MAKSREFLRTKPKKVRLMTLQGDSERERDIYIYVCVCIYSHVHIYIYIYICCGGIIWAKFGLLRCYYLGQVCFFTKHCLSKTL